MYCFSHLAVKMRSSLRRNLTRFSILELHLKVEECWVIILYCINAVFITAMCGLQVFA